MRLKVTSCGHDSGDRATAADLDVGLAASTVLCEQHSSSWRRRQRYAAEMASAADGWWLLCSGPSAAEAAAITEAAGAEGTVKIPAGTSVSNGASRKVVRLPNRAASWHCELRSGDLLTMVLEVQPHQAWEPGVTTGTVSFFLNSNRILQADIPSHQSVPRGGPHSAEDNDGVASSEGQGPVFHVIAFVRQPGVGLTLGCDDDARLHL